MTESILTLQVNGRDTQLYEQAGLLTQQTVMAHGVTLTDAELQLLAKRGTAIAHCPLSNFYFADVPLDVLRCLKAGVKVWQFQVDPTHFRYYGFQIFGISALLVKPVIEKDYPSQEHVPFSQATCSMDRCIAVHDCCCSAKLRRPPKRDLKMRRIPSRCAQIDVGIWLMPLLRTASYESFQ